MPDPSTLEDLLDIHAIQRLKHRYFRCLDQKAWGELETCFTEDATASYGGGAIELRGDGPPTTRRLQLNQLYSVGAVE